MESIFIVLLHLVLALKITHVYVNICHLCAGAYRDQKSVLALRAYEA